MVLDIVLKKSKDVVCNAFTLVGGRQAFNEACGATGVSSGDKATKKNVDILNVSVFSCCVILDVVMIKYYYVCIIYTF